MSGVFFYPDDANLRKLKKLWAVQQRYFPSPKPPGEVKPSGTLSLVTACSAGIEPLFTTTFVRSRKDFGRFLKECS
jgi:hypothetical protein